MTPLRTVDQAVRQSEMKWGPVYLPLLVGPQTRQAWDRGWDLFTHAVRNEDEQEQARLAPMLVRALAVMDAEATAGGARTARQRLEDGSPVSSTTQTPKTTQTRHRSAA